jgi:hypothetical protein
MSTFPQFNFKNINASGTTVVARQGGLLHNVVINTTSASGIAIYDGTTVGGTLIATIASGAINSGTTINYDVRFTAGLTVVVGGNQDITLSIG